MKFRRLPACFVVLSALLLNSSTVSAFLDFDQEVLHIPATHESKKYTWQVRENPQGFNAIFEMNGTVDENTPGHPGHLVKLAFPPDETVEEVHMFIVDKKFKFFTHILPDKKKDNVYAFDPEITRKGKYRIETILKMKNDWVRLNQNINFAPKTIKTENTEKESQGYTIKVKKIPGKVYADHVVTFVFEITLDGKPMTGLEKTGGSEIHLAAWGTSFFKRFGEFTYATSAQNLGGPEAAVSMVFMDNGLHKVFAQFKHRAEIHTVETEVSVYFEPVQGEKKISDMTPPTD